MDNSVTIKGNKNGIVVILDNEMPFDEIKEKVALKFRDSAKFLGDCKTAIAFEGRELDEEQELELLEIIGQNSELDVVCILGNGKDKREEHFSNAVNDTIMNHSMNNATFYKGNLRSGQCIESDNGVILLGDVNPGASIISDGNIIILGALKGTAFAGASGNRNAFVMAFEMNPMQIRIADTIARAPDKPDKEMLKETKIAFLEDGNIYIEPASKNVINEIKLSC